MRPLSASLGAVLLAAALTSCAEQGGPGAGPTPSDTPTSARTQSPGATESAAPTEPPAPTIRDFDFGNAEWSYAPGGVELPIVIPLADGTATVGTATYEVGDAVFADADADGFEDAAVSISSADGNGFEQLWYVWAGGPDGVTQIIYPVARSSRCGASVESVEGTTEGFIVHDFLRMASDTNISCAERGSGERTRTLTLESVGTVKWPVQVAPVTAFGGICPGSPWLDEGFPERMELRAIPSVDGPPASTVDETIHLFELHPAPLTDIDGWMLIGFLSDRASGLAVPLQCAWYQEGTSF